MYVCIRVRASVCVCVCVCVCGCVGGWVGGWVAEWVLVGGCRGARARACVSTLATR